MINWNTSFINPYATALENGSFGDARDHARAITTYYIDSVTTGTIPGIFPLPSPALGGALAPIGPGIAVPRGVAKTREKVFYNTVLAYYQAKEISQGKANVQDLIVSIKRLLIKADKLNRRIESLSLQYKTIQQQIKAGGTQEALEQLAIQNIRILSEIERDRQKLKNFIEPKIRELTDLSKMRLEEIIGKSKKFAQSQTLASVTKTIRQVNQLLDRELFKNAKKTKKLLKIIAQCLTILGKIAAITLSLKKDFELVKKAVESKYRQVRITDQISNISNEYQLREAADFKSISTLGNRVLGQTSTLGEVLLSSLTIYDISIEELKDIFHTVDAKYDAYVSELVQLIDIEIPYLNMLIEAYDTDEVVEKPKGTFQNEKATLADVIRLITKGEKDAKETESKAQSKINKIKEQVNTKIKKTKSDLEKYVEELKTKNPKTVKKLNKAKKKYSDTSAKYEEFREEQIILQEVRNAADIIAASTGIATNLSSGRYFIKDNQQFIKKLFRGYYNHLKVTKKMSPAEANTERREKEDKLRELADYEMLILLLVDLFKELKNKTLIEEFKQDVELIKSTLSKETQNTIDAFTNLIENPPSKSDLSAVEQLSTSLLSNTQIVGILYGIEQKYLRKFVQGVATVADAIPERKEKLSEFVQSFYLKVRKTPSLILMLLEYVKKGIKQAKDYIIELLEPIKKSIKEQLEARKVKARDKANEKIQQKKEKSVNVDAKAMSFVFNIATRLFWTGLSWQNPVGTTFVVTNIGSFKPIKALPVNGALGIAEEIGTSFQNQLKVQMTGQVIPAPALGIVPFPFSGYN